MIPNPDNIGELARLAGEFKAAFDTGMRVVSDGGNILGAINAVTETQDMLVAKAVEIREEHNKQPKTVYLRDLLAHPQCQVVIDQLPMVSFDHLPGNYLTIYSDDDLNDPGPIYLEDDKEIELPVPEGGVEVTAMVTEKKHRLWFNHVRQFMPGDIDA